MPEKEKAILFSPLINEESSELYYFAPKAIHLKNSNKNHKLIVLTFSSRFDFYGQYADILVPLNFNEIVDEEITLNDFTMVQGYSNIINLFSSQFKKRFHVTSHYYPVLQNALWKNKSVFNAVKSNFSFKPRKENHDLISTLKENDNKELILVDLTWIPFEAVKKDITSQILCCDKNYINNIVILDSDSKKYYIYNKKGIENKIEIQKANKNISFFGSILSLMKNSVLVFSDPNTAVGLASILCKIPVVSIFNTGESIKNFNIFSTPIHYFQNPDVGEFRISLESFLSKRGI